MEAPPVGILAGISYVSGIDYYKGVVEQYALLVGKRQLMPPNPLLYLASVDCDAYAKMLTEKPMDFDAISEHLCVGVEAVVKAGAAFLAIASNTGHIAVPLVRTRFPDLPVLHIGDCTAMAIKASGATSVGLLGTEPTMREDYLKLQLEKHGIHTLVPDSEQDLTQIFKYIMNELGFNVFKDTTREFFVAQIRALAARGAQGVILGCTEIELLVRQTDVPEVPLYCSAELHIEAVARVQAGIDTVAQFMPQEDVASGYTAKLRGVHGEINLDERWLQSATSAGSLYKPDAGDTDSENGGTEGGHNAGEELTRLAAGSVIAAVFGLIGGVVYRLLRYRRRLPRAARP